MREQLDESCGVCPLYPSFKRYAEAYVELEKQATESPDFDFYSEGLLDCKGFRENTGLWYEKTGSCPARIVPPEISQIVLRAGGIEGTVPVQITNPSKNHVRSLLKKVESQNT